MTTVRAALSGGPWLVALWLIGHVLAGRPAPASAAPPSDVLADCARRYAVEAVIAVCTDRQEAAQERLSQRVDIEPALRAACDEVSDTWTSLEVCIARVRQTQYTWALWSFGGEYAGRLFRGQDWQVIALGFDSPEACEDAIAGHLNALNATVLLIDREPSDQQELRVPTEREGRAISSSLPSRMAARTPGRFTACARVRIRASNRLNGRLAEQGKR